MRPKFLILVDVVLIAAATVLALVLRSNFDVSAEQVGAFLPYLTVTTLTSAVVIYCSGMDRQIWRFTMLPDYLRLANLCIAIVVCTLVAVFAYNRMDGVARALPIIQIILMSVALISARVLYRVHRARRTGRNRVDAVAPVSGESCVLIVGLNPVTELFVNCARLYASKRIAICGIVSERPSATAGRAAFGLPVLGEIAKLSEVLSTLEVHGTNVLRLVVTADLDLLSPSQRLCITALERRGDIAVEYFAEQLDFVERRRPTDTALIVPFKLADTASFDAASLDGVTAASRRLFWPMKRGFDAAVAALILTLLAAPLLIVGLLALVAIGAPVLFWQYRPGLYGLRFKVYKFRTMLGAHDKAGVRIPDGERRSGLGSIMRVIRVDELPQLFNVLRGDMAFIGPRPLLLAEQAACPAARLLVRPGLTGWAQVNGGRKLSVNDKLVLDLWYIKHASCKLDLQIALRTVGLLIWGEQINTRVIAAARKEFGLKGLPTDQSRDRRGDHTDTQSSESLGLLKGYSADAVRSNVL